MNISKNIIHLPKIIEQIMTRKCIWIRKNSKQTDERLILFFFQKQIWNQRPKKPTHSNFRLNRIIIFVSILDPPFCFWTFRKWIWDQWFIKPVQTSSHSNRTIFWVCLSLYSGQKYIRILLLNYLVVFYSIFLLKILLFLLFTFC